MFSWLVFQQRILITRAKNNLEAFDGQICSNFARNGSQGPKRSQEAFVSENVYIPADSRFTAYLFVQVVLLPLHDGDAPESQGRKPGSQDDGRCQGDGQPVEDAHSGGEEAVRGDGCQGQSSLRKGSLKNA